MTHDLAVQLAGQFGRELARAIDSYSLAMQEGCESTFTCTVKFCHDDEMGPYVKMRFKTAPGIAERQVKLSMTQGQLDLFRAPAVEDDAL